MLPTGTASPFTRSIIGSTRRDNSPGGPELPGNHSPVAVSGAAGLRRKLFPRSQSWRTASSFSSLGDRRCTRRGEKQQKGVSRRCDPIARRRDSRTFVNKTVCASELAWMYNLRGSGTRLRGYQRIRAALSACQRRRLKTRRLTACCRSWLETPRYRCVVLMFRWPARA